jgi:hypothetical protein
MSERHPIPEAPPDMSLEERVRHLEIKLAQLWDQVWWMSLQKDQREFYEHDGFTAPILKFYEEL